MQCPNAPQSTFMPDFTPLQNSTPAGAMPTKSPGDHYPKTCSGFSFAFIPTVQCYGLIQEEKYRKNIYNWRVLIDCKRLDLNQFSLPESFFFSQGNKNWNDFDKAKRWQSSIFLFVIIFVHTSLEKEPVSVASFSNRGILRWLNWS